MFLLKWDTIAPGRTNLLQREFWAPRTLHLELLFFLAKPVFGQGTVLASNIGKMHSDVTGRAGYKKNDCETFSRQHKRVLNKSIKSMLISKWANCYLEAYILFEIDANIFAYILYYYLLCKTLCWLLTAILIPINTKLQSLLWSDLKS